MSGSSTVSGSHQLPSTVSTSRLPDLRPAPQVGLTSQTALPPFNFGQQQVLPQQSLQSPTDPPPTHVVGSQGRRGVLPSAPGRPVAVPGTAVAGKTQPQKDAEGKYPCEHCNKTYLHLKHLKRHMLRHTGDRPYQCHLCKDTFSRSDILKRHFQKCSLRRGNPTGANHLQHSQSHLRRNSQHANRTPMSSMAESSYSTAMDHSNIVNGHMPTPTGPSMSGGSIQTDPAAYQNGMNSLSNRSSRSNSAAHSGSAIQSQRNSLSGIGHLTSSARQSFDHQHLANNFSTGVSAPGMQSYAMPQGMQGHMGSQDLTYGNSATGGPMNLHVKTEEASIQGYSRPSVTQYDSAHSGLSSDFDWQHIFSQQNHDPFALTGNTPNDAAIKHQPGSGHSTNMHSPTDGVPDAVFNSLYPQPSSMGIENLPSALPTWNLEMVPQDLMQSKSDALLAFCFSTTSFDPHMDQDLKQCFTTEGIKHFISQYTNFHGHWPMIHTPSFNIMAANTGLVAAMICVGAVYSDKVGLNQVRRLMDVVYSAVRRHSRVFGVMTGSVVERSEVLQVEQSDVEEIQSLILSHTQFTWHGNPTQREEAKRDWLVVANIPKRFHLLQPIAPGQMFYSPLHYQNFAPEHININAFDWTSWIEQEKRTRTMNFLFLTDTARVLFFNAQQQIDPWTVRVPLPADDAAWDAKSAIDCAEALGLNGEVAQGKNVTGSRRPKQIAVNEALRELLKAGHEFPPRATNALSKFVLIHAIIVLISDIQRQFAASAAGPYSAFPSSGTNTPNSHNEWMSGNATQANSRNISANSSGRGTPIEGQMAQQNYHQSLQAVNNALDKWKRTWDHDMNLQYPPAASIFRRFGFCRDGVHFYWLARSLIINPRTATDPQTPPDTRFKRMMSTLRKVRSRVVDDNSSRGHQVGSVADIDDHYGMDELAFDMKKLFKPINEQLDSPLSGVQTYVGTTMI
ncbi:hypothetical protein EV356DRAFT_444811 [Viridothelium virens]|uniref:C2H2-type domain-containing protein n=1 Tax=Viridothelium virens TaxID=1048519 RepID=A0A6A6HCP7_VIRVR|nr:hypothetical protein EV356DRAFT_444811 [Viridothelium virens]